VDLGSRGPRDKWDDTDSARSSALIMYHTYVGCIMCRVVTCGCRGQFITLSVHLQTGVHVLMLSVQAARLARLRAPGTECSLCRDDVPCRGCRVSWQGSRATRRQSRPTTTSYDSSPTSAASSASGSAYRSLLWSRWSSS